MSSDDAARIGANLQLFGGACEYAVKSALRRCAQYTVTRTKRDIASDTGNTQKSLRNRIAGFSKTEPINNTPAFRAWMGNKRRVGLDTAKARKLAGKSAFSIPGRKGLWRRKGEDRFPIESVAIRLGDHVDKLERNGRQAWRTVYPQRLQQELRRRVKRARSGGEARQMQSALKALNQSINRERALDGNL